MAVAIVKGEKGGLKLSKKENRNSNQRIWIKRGEDNAWKGGKIKVERLLNKKWWAKVIC